MRSGATRAPASAIAAPKPPAALRDYELIALCLQGGGALGAYQAGAFEALAAAGIQPHWVSGISIGAINAAIIAGNPPELRVARLREFWHRVSIPTGAPTLDGPFAAASFFGDLAARSLAGFWSSSLALLRGQDGFFRPRVPPAWARGAGEPGADSYYDTEPLRETLARLVDFRRINAGGMRLSVGAVNVETGNFEWFDTASHPVTIDHVLASGALPPAFPAVRVTQPKDKRGWYWDGGLVSNTPLEYVLDATPRQDTLAFQVDLWSARGPRPRDLLDVFERQKDVQFSSRTRAGTDRFAQEQQTRHAIARALDALPPSLRSQPAFRRLQRDACRKVMNIVHLIYQAKAFENHAKDYEFSEPTMLGHWQAGHADVVGTLAMPRVLARPNVPVRTHDLHRRS